MKRPEMKRYLAILLGFLLSLTLMVPVTHAAGFVSQISGTAATLHGVYFRDENVGLAVGTSGVIRKTLNGGSTWTTSASGTTTILNKVSIIPGTSIVYVVGAGGVIRKSIDLGTVWSAQTSGTTAFLYGVSFASTTAGLVVGEDGIIRKTLNGGSIWTASASGTTTTLENVFIIPGTSIAYAVGKSGVIRKTSDLGTTWSGQTSGTSAILNAVHFANTSHGWIVGNSGIILHTSNGGGVWTAQTSGTGAHLLGVQFLDAMNGWIAGDDGVILKTVNGGETWSDVSSGTISVLFGIHFVNAGTGWTVGSSGVIRRYDAIDTTAPPANNAPNPPTGLAERDNADGGPDQAAGYTDNDGTIFLRGMVSDPDASQGVRFQLEVRPVGTAFANVPTATSIAYVSGLTAQYPLAIANGSYHWQARSIDPSDATSAWISFGGNAESAADFTISTSSFPPPDTTDPETNITSGPASSTASMPTATPPPTSDRCAGFIDVSANDPNCAAIQYVKNLGAMTGNPDGTFDSNGLLQRDQIAKIVLETFNLFNQNLDYCRGNDPFPDVTEAHWSYQYICRGVSLGMITGYRSGKDAGFYRPGRSVNRVEFLALLLRNVSDDMPDNANSSYVDVQAGQWYSGYAKYSQVNGLFTGAYLYPSNFVSRNEVAKVIFKLHGQGKF